MLISLVHAGGEHDAATAILRRDDFDSSDDTLRRRLEWVRAIATPGGTDVPPTPFSEAQLPEVIGTLMGMSDINRFSHVVMEDSPVRAPFGIDAIKAWALKAFGNELRVTRDLPLAPGRALSLLPPAKLPPDLAWASPNPRIAKAVARWAAAVEREGAKAISRRAREAVSGSLRSWNGERMPLDTRWVEDDVRHLAGEDQAIARLAIMLAKAPYRVTDRLVADVLASDRTEERFVRILAWASFAAARNFARIVVEKIDRANATHGNAIAA